jgi:general secretion pathway protein C
LLKDLVMQILVRRNMFILDLTIIGVCALFLARASAGAIEAKLPNPAPQPGCGPRPSSPVLVPHGDVGAIVRRNLFCSSCPPPVTADPAPPSVEEHDLAEKSALPLSLLAVMHDRRRRSAWSAAVIRDADRGTGIFSEGEVLRDATVTFIGESRVYLDRAGRREYLDLADGSSRAGAAPESPRRSADPLSQQLDRGIRKTGPYAYELERATLESVLQNLNLLSASASLVPEMKDGRAAGFRLYRVRPDGPFARIGLQNGDVISSLNGLELTSVEKSLEVYTKLKSAGHASLGLERNGTRVTIDYAIR